jgi:hypothetical protein
MIYNHQPRLLAAIVSKTITIANNLLVSIRYLQKMHLYTLKQTKFCIFIVILDGYTRVPSFETKSELIAFYSFCGDLAKRSVGICQNVVIG